MTPYLITFLTLSLVGVLIWLLVDPDPGYSLRCLARENGVDLAEWWRKVRSGNCSTSCWQSSEGGCNHDLLPPTPQPRPMAGAPRPLRRPPASPAPSPRRPCPHPRPPRSPGHRSAVDDV